MREIPLTTYPKQSLAVALSGRALTMKLRFANLLGIWELDILDRDTDPATPLVVGVPIVTSVDLVAPYALEIGGLVAVAVERPGEDPGRTEIGRRVRLLHLTAEEIEAAEAAS